MASTIENICARQVLDDVRALIARNIVGQDALIESIMLSFVAGGHILIEGLPGLAKTLTAKTFAQIFDLSFKRIQFSADLLPSDVTGNLVFVQDKGRFAMRRGPIFANICLLDELNRAPAKVQSALLEAMEEKQVTVGRRTYALAEPFFVLATENPMDEEGTYQLSQAQKDRFLMKELVAYPSKCEEVQIVQKASLSQLSLNSDTTTVKNSFEPSTSSVAPTVPENMLFQTPYDSNCDAKKEGAFTLETLRALRSKAEEVNVSVEITKYIVSLVVATRPPQASREASKDMRGSFNSRSTLDDLHSYIQVGASPRASIALQILARILAMFRGRSYVIPEDVKYLALPVLRHRIKLSFEAMADGVNEEEVVSSILDTVPQP